MPRLYLSADADPAALHGKAVAVLGYGSQGRAQALNLRDSKVDIRVAARPGGESSERASHDGFIPVTVSEATKGADVLVFCLPDVDQGRLFEESVRPNLKAGATLIFAHGFAIHYGLIRPPTEIDVALVAPMGAGPVVRARFESGTGVPGLIAIHRDFSQNARRTALAYGAAIGCARVALLETTFKEETESDLFGEQAVLCGGLPFLMLSAFETAVNGGIAPEIAYIACIHEVKLIVDLMYEKGLDGLVQNISQTAEWGAYETGPKVAGEAMRKAMAESLRRIQSGEFAKEWIEEAASGSPTLQSRRSKFLSHPIHPLGGRLRELFGIAPPQT